jgi:two-component system invasion response regulator UvrY
VSARIFIVDDHPLIREGLKKILADERRFSIVGESPTGAGIAVQLGERRCDVLILDISLPDKGGLEVLGEIKKARPGTRVLVLSMHPEEGFAVRALENGADGYLSKNCAPEQLVPALRTVLAGRKYVSRTLAQHLACRLQKTRPRKGHELLSPKEFQVLLRLGGGDTVTRAAAKMNLSVSTLNTHRRHILKKLGLETSAEIIRYVVENGLRG